MLCFMCLLEIRENPCKAVTFIAGSACCREHIITVANAAAARTVNTPRNGATP